MRSLPATASLKASKISVAMRRLGALHGLAGIDIWVSAKGTFGASKVEGVGLKLCELIILDGGMGGGSIAL